MTATAKIDQKDGEKYVRIVESYRDASGMSRMCTLVSLGKLDYKKMESLKRLGTKLYQAMGGIQEELACKNIT